MWVDANENGIAEAGELHSLASLDIAKISARFSRVADFARPAERDGWRKLQFIYLVATRGSHRQYKHPKKPGRVTIAGQESHDLPPGTLNSILKQAQLKDPRSPKHDA